jgi:hypothetical protein
MSNEHFRQGVGRRDMFLRGTTLAATVGLAASRHAAPRA